METKVLLPFLVFLTFDSVLGNSCGGLLEGEQGHFSLAETFNPVNPENSSSSCLWIIQLHYENNIRFTLDALGDNALLNLYPEDQLTSCSLSEYTKLNSSQVGSSFELLGKTLIVILPNSSAAVAFSWHFIDIGDNNRSSVAIMKNSDYLSSPNGLLEWEQLETVERMTWGINANEIFNIKWDVDVAKSCDAIDNCACFHLAMFQLTSEGVLNEAVRTCGQSSEGKLEGIRERAVVLFKVNTKVGANKVVVSWEVDKPELPAPKVTGLFAATFNGLIALNLQTLEASALTNKSTSAVAVNHNVQKVYWSEITGNCSIVRSNFNGSEQEVIIPPTGEDIAALAIEEKSGNIYFGLAKSNEIKVCDALGRNCTVIIANSSLVQGPHSISLDSKNNVMYWSSPGSAEGAIIRANLNGSNATVISTGYRGLTDITLAPPSNEILYWVDATGNTTGTVDINGDNKRILVELDAPPFGIQVDASKVYFGNSKTRIIYSANRDSGDALTPIFNSTGSVQDLALFSSPTR